MTSKTKKEIKSIQDSMKKTADEKYEKHLEKQLLIIAEKGCSGKGDRVRFVYNWERKTNAGKSKKAQIFIDNMDSLIEEDDSEDRIRGINF